MTEASCDGTAVVAAVTATGEASCEGANLEHERGAPVMSRELIRAQCKKHGGYSTEELNEKLFLLHFGFTRVQNLELYTGCRVLYLSYNAIQDFRPLAPLVHLTALHASNNALESCTFLPPLPSLETLDVANNFLSDLKGVAAAAPQLETLLASHNRIERTHADDFACFEKLSTLDLAFNKLTEEEKLLSSLSRDPVRGTLRTVILEGNDLQRRARHYRKRVITQFPSLRMLDALPVFPEEREKAEAFVRGGAEAEAHAREAIRQRQAEEHDAQFRYHGSFMAGARGRRLMEGPRTSPTAYFDDNAPHPADGGPRAEHTDTDTDGVYIPSSP